MSCEIFILADLIVKYPGMYIYTFVHYTWTVDSEWCGAESAAGCVVTNK